MNAVIYLDCNRDITDSYPHLCGVGLHGYLYDMLPAVFYPSLPFMVAPAGYVEKFSAVKIKELKKPPVFSYGDTSVEFNPKPYTGECDAKVFDAWYGLAIPDVSTGLGEAKNQIIVLAKGLLEFLRQLPKVDNIIIHLVSHSFGESLAAMETYDKMQWRTASGEAITGAEALKEIREILKDQKWEVMYPAANKPLPEWFDATYRNGMYGVAAACKGNSGVLTYIEGAITDKLYWTAEKPIPDILRVKWIYSLQNKPLAHHTINDRDYVQYFVGDHNSGADDIEMLGMKRSTVCYGVVLLPEEVPIIHEVADFHTKAVWGPESRNYRYDTMMLLNTTNINKPQAAWELKHVGLENLMLKNNRNELVGYDNSPISIVMRPPRLSYRIMEEEHEMVTVLNSTLHQLGHNLHKEHFVPMAITINDFTDNFYTRSEVKGKPVVKMTDFYSNANDSVEVLLENPVAIPTKVLLVRGIDLPPRNNMAKLADDNPKVYVITWMFSKCVFRYATVIVCDNSISIWAGVYSNRRVVMDGLTLPNALEELAEFLPKVKK